MCCEADGVYLSDMTMWPARFELKGMSMALQVVLRRTAIIEATIGAPGLSIPIGLADDKMPVGFQLQSRPGRHLLSTFYNCACFALEIAWGAVSPDMACKQSIPRYPGCGTQQLMLCTCRASILIRCAFQHLRHKLLSLTN